MSRAPQASEAPVRDGAAPTPAVHHHRGGAQPRPDVDAPRVLALGKGWFPAQTGGLNRYLYDLDAALRARGVVHRPVVIGPISARGSIPPDPAGPGPAEPGPRPVGTHAWPLARRIAAFHRAAVREAAGSDLVDVHFALFAALPLRSAALRSKPLVVHFHGPWAAESDRGPASTLVRAGIERAVYRRAAAVVTLSRAFAEEVCEGYGVDPGRVHVLAPGVDLHRYAPGDVRAARATLGLPVHGRVVVTVRRLVPRMGLDVLLDAWSRLRTPARLYVIGEGQARGDLERRAARLGLGDRVHFPGRVPEEELPVWYRAADLTCVPSTALEGFGLVVLESLASGTPVLSSDVGGLPGTVGRIGDGWVLPAGDVRAWAHRLDEVLGSPGATPPPQRLRALAEEHSWTSVAAAHQRLYTRVMTCGG